MAKGLGEAPKPSALQRPQASQAADGSTGSAPGGVAEVAQVGETTPASRIKHDKTNMLKK